MRFARPSLNKTFIPVERYPADFHAGAFHAFMLRNVAKYSQFRQVFDAVCRDKTVLDIGTGSCILSLLALKAKARRVIAVERPGVAEFSKEVLRALDVRHDQVELVVGDFLQLDPAVRDVDVAVCETVGYLGLEEDICRLMQRARSHWLKPAGLVVPRSIDVRLVPGFRQLSDSHTQAFLSAESVPSLRVEPESLSTPVRLGNPQNDATPVAFESRWRITSSQPVDSVTVEVHAQLWGAVAVSNRGVRNWPRCVIPLGGVVTAIRQSEARFKLAVTQRGASFEVSLEAELQCERSGRVHMEKRFLSEDILTKWPQRSEPVNLVSDVLQLLRRC